MISGRGRQSRIASFQPSVTDRWFGASTADPEIRRPWRDGVLEARIRATEAAIRRDQSARVLRSSIVPGDTARSLTLRLEAVALEVLGRRGGTPEEFARLTAPIWTHVLFSDGALPGRADDA